MRVFRGTSWAAVCLLALVVAMDVFGGSAAARTGIGLVSRFGAPGSGIGQFTEPSAVAVDQSTGDVYVTDTGNNRVEKFDAEGKYIAELLGGEGQCTAFSRPTAIALDNSTGSAKGNIYVVDSGHAAVDEFQPVSGTAFRCVTQIVGAGAPHPFVSVSGVAVDNSGNLWVSEEYTGEAVLVDEFDATGQFISSPLLSDSENALVQGLSVDGSDDVYLAEGNGEVSKWTLQGGAWRSAEFDSRLGGLTRVAVDLASSDVYIDHGTYVVIREPSGALIENLGVFNNVSGGLGLAVNGVNGDVYVVEQPNNQVDVFAETLLPDARTGSASSVSVQTATVSGTVNPDGTATEYFFEYGPSTSYGSSTPMTSIGSGASEEPVQADLAGLEAQTTYHYRIVAVNEHGATYGADAVFTTLAAVEGLNTGPATGIQATSATLHGSFEPAGKSVRYYFEYGASEAFGSFTATSEVPASQPGPVQVALPVEGLTPGTTYAYRLVGEDELGATRGESKRFTTPPLAPVIESEEASEVSSFQTTLRGTLNPGNGTTNYYFEYGTTSSYDQSTAQSAGVTSGLKTVSTAPQAVEDLQPAVTYHYRLVAVNSGGIGYGPDQTFTTRPAAPPSVVSDAPEDVAATSATLTGRVAMGGLPTVVGFEFGTTTAYGSILFGVQAGSPSAEATVSLPLLDLQPGVTYHYRVMATNEAGTSYGADVSFTTPGAPQQLSPFAAPLFVPVLAFPPVEVATAKHVARHKKRRAKHRRRHRHKRRRHRSRR